MNYQAEIERAESGLARLQEQQKQVSATMADCRQRRGMLLEEIAAEQLRVDVGDVTDETALASLRDDLAAVEANLQGAQTVSGEFAERIALVNEELALRRYQANLDEFAVLCESDLDLQHRAARTLVEAVEAWAEARAHFDTKNRLYRRIDDYRSSQGLPESVELGIRGVPFLPNLGAYFGGAVREPVAEVRRRLAEYLEVDD